MSVDYEHKLNDRVMPDNSIFSWDGTSPMAIMSILRRPISIQMTRSTSGTEWFGSYEDGGEIFDVRITSFENSGEEISGDIMRIESEPEIEIGSRRPDDTGSFAGTKNQ